ncbi:CBS domain-containing protein [Haloferacaceae archaeon DSL9]
MTIIDIAATDVVTAQPTDQLTDVVQRMADENVGAVVITEGDDPVGIVTDRTVALSIADGGSIEDLTAADVMTDEPMTVTEDEGLFEVVQAMGEAGVRRVPIVDDGGALSGIVSMDDFLVVFATEFERLADIIESQSPRL